MSLRAGRTSLTILLRLEWASSAGQCCPLARHSTRLQYHFMGGIIAVQHASNGARTVRVGPLSIQCHCEPLKQARLQVLPSERRKGHCPLAREPGFSSLSTRYQTLARVEKLSPVCSRSKKTGSTSFAVLYDQNSYNLLEEGHSVSRDSVMLQYGHKN